MEWHRETPGAETYGPEGLAAEAKRCAEDGTPPPDAEAFLALSRERGWPGFLSPVLDRLVRYEAHRESLGDAAVEGPSGPIVSWPFGRWALAECRATIAHHFRASGAISRSERDLLGM